MPQAHRPRLLILRDSDNPVIDKYVSMKQAYGADIGVEVDVRTVPTQELGGEIKLANDDPSVSGMIVQLPILQPEKTEEVVGLIAPGKDVDGLNSAAEKSDRKFDSATATAILWLLAGNGIDLKDKKIALVGRGKLVGAPLEKMLVESGYAPRVFTSKNADEVPAALPDYDIIISAVGKPGILQPEMVKPDAAIVDAGTASEDGVIKGDASDALRERTDIKITPKIGGVGPLTVAVLFENTIRAAKSS